MPRRFPPPYGRAARNIRFKDIVTQAAPGRTHIKREVNPYNPLPLRGRVRVGVNPCRPPPRQLAPASRSPYNTPNDTAQPPAREYRHAHYPQRPPPKHPRNRPRTPPGRPPLRPSPRPHGRRSHQSRAPRRRGNPLPRPLGQQTIVLLGAVQLRQKIPVHRPPQRRRQRRPCANWSKSPTSWCRISAPAPSKIWASATTPSRNSTPASSWSTYPPTASSALTAITSATTPSGRRCPASRWSPARRECPRSAPACRSSTASPPSTPPSAPWPRSTSAKPPAWAKAWTSAWPTPAIP